VETGLSDDWRAWVVDNALDGVGERDLLEELVRGGVPADIAAREVAALLSSPSLDACRRLRRRALRAEAVLSLRARLERGVPIERRSTPPAKELFERYFAQNRPVVLTDATARWPALGKWTPEWFKERFGDVEIECAKGREGDPEADANLDKYRTKLTMRAYVDLVLAAGETNDLYTVANNQNMDLPALRPLWDDVAFDDELFDGAHLAGGASLWIGPKGTTTRLHHDTTNILFNQLHGRKRFVLVSPMTQKLLGPTFGFYSERSLDDVLADPDIDAHVVDVGPGDSLFLPVGWWHHVRALDVSISFSLLNFRRPNDFSEYRPGHLG
jgi:hypothetical protein